VPPPTQAQPPAAPRIKSGQSKVAFVVAGPALLLVIAVLVAGRVLLGSFLPGLLLVATIAIIGVTVAIRSGQPVPRKAMTVTAIVLVVAAAVPASLKVVYPVYHHFFNDGTSQASPPAQASPPTQGSPPSQVSTGPSSAPTGSPNSGAAQYKIILDGQDITAEGGAVGGVGCTRAAEEDAYHVNAGPPSDQDPKVTATIGTSDPPRVTDFTLTRYQKSSNPYLGREISWHWQPRFRPGNVSVTKSGNTYKFTGNIAIDPSLSHGVPSGLPCPLSSMRL
jgi:hypothetical protein